MAVSRAAWLIQATLLGPPAPGKRRRRQSALPAFNSRPEHLSTHYSRACCLSHVLISSELSQRATALGLPGRPTPPSPCSVGSCSDLSSIAAGTMKRRRSSHRRLSYGGAADQPSKAVETLEAKPLHINDLPACLLLEVSIARRLFSRWVVAEGNPSTTLQNAAF